MKQDEFATVKIKRNNMEEKMFCFQCQETAKGTGCTLRGVCGKLPQTAKYMDLLLSVVRGVAIANNALSQAHVDTDAQAADFIVDALFATITNANFDDESILARVDKGVALRNALIAKAKANDIALPDYAEITWDGDKATYDEQGAKMGVKRNQNEDIRSLKELTMYGLKGMAAYYEHAARLGFTDTCDYRLHESCARHHLQSRCPAG
jgi:hydroxylamine reductase